MECANGPWGSLRETEWEDNPRLAIFWLELAIAVGRGLLPFVASEFFSAFASSVVAGVGSSPCVCITFGTYA